MVCVTIVWLLAVYSSAEATLDRTLRPQVSVTVAIH
jgi:hypothetical protein